MNQAAHHPGSRRPLEACIFDIGNVLLKFDYLIAAHRLVEKNGLPGLPDREPVIAAKAELECGRIQRAEFLRRVRPHFGDHGADDSPFLRIWEDIFEINEPMAAFARRLSERLPTYLLSNISCIHREFIFRHHAMFQSFRNGVYSYEAGAMKPDPAIFHIATKSFGIDPQTTAFIDDMPENVETARSLGFQAILYDHRDHPSFEQTFASLG